MKEKKEQTQKKNSLTEKKKFLLFLRISARKKSLKNYSLVSKTKKEIAREMTFISLEKKSKGNFH